MCQYNGRLRRPLCGSDVSSQPLGDRVRSGSCVCATFQKLNCAKLKCFRTLKGHLELGLHDYGHNIIITIIFVNIEITIINRNFFIIIICLFHFFVFPNKQCVNNALLILLIIIPVTQSQGQLTVSSQ